MNELTSEEILYKDFPKLSKRERAQLLGHKAHIVEQFQTFWESIGHYKSDEIDELYILYFLPMILWSSKFKLIAEVVKDDGWESRLKQWTEACGQSQSKGDILVKRLDECKEAGSGAWVYPYFLQFSGPDSWSYTMKTTEEGSGHIFSRLKEAGYNIVWKK